MKRNFVIQIKDESREELASVAEAAHTDVTKYGAMILEEFAQLKPEFALRALGLIPAEWKHRRPGRPTSTRTADRKDGTMPQEHVA